MEVSNKKTKLSVVLVINRQSILIDARQHFIKRDEKFVILKREARNFFYRLITSLKVLEWT